MKVEVRIDEDTYKRFKQSGMTATEVFEKGLISFLLEEEKHDVRKRIHVSGQLDSEQVKLMKEREISMKDLFLRGLK